MVSDLLFRIQGISLKWKLLIPFLLFSFLGISTLAYIGLSSQELLIKKEEQRTILNLYRLFLAEINHKLTSALSLASAISSMPDLPPLLAAGDRKALTDLLSPIFTELSTKRGVRILHLHEPPAKSFLRLHLLEEHGEDLSNRRTVRNTISTGQSAGGLEWGKAGLGIRGVVPVSYNGAIVGSLEVGYSFDREFLMQLKEFWGSDFTEMEKGAETLFKVRASTLPEGIDVPYAGGLPEVPGDEPIIHIAPKGYRNRSVLIGLFRDSAGEVAGVVRIDVDRSNILARLINTRLIMAVAGVTGCIISSILIWIVAILFLKPIKEIVKGSREIALGLRSTLLGRRPEDEIGALTRSLNTMLLSLQDKQRQIEDYARTLEVRVQDRTADLVRSEEKYRTLVENLPLIVYRLQLDGTTEFVNPCFTETLGYSPEEVASDRNFWRRHICGKEGTDGNNILDDCWGDDVGFRTERVVKSKDGRSLNFIDHSIPCIDQNEKVVCIDGIMVDITELKRLQEREVRAEELRVLGGISERFAHELRNPLASAGGFARRLRDALPQGTTHKRFAEIIVEEVARLEDIVRLMLSAIKPVVLCYAPVRLKDILNSLLLRLQSLGRERGITLVTSLEEDLAEFHGDETLLARAFETLLTNALITMQGGKKLEVSAVTQDDHIIVTVTYPCENLAEEDLAQYFFPRMAAAPGSLALELPLSKVIIHRHGGKIDVMRGNLHNVIIKVELPTGSHHRERQGLNGSGKDKNGESYPA